MRANLSAIQMSGDEAMMAGFQVGTPEYNTYRRSFLEQTTQGMDIDGILAIMETGAGSAGQAGGQPGSAHATAQAPYQGKDHGQAQAWAEKEASGGGGGMAGKVMGMMGGGGGGGAALAGAAGGGGGATTSPMPSGRQTAWDLPAMFSGGGAPQGQAPAPQTAPARPEAGIRSSFVGGSMSPAGGMFGGGPSIKKAPAPVQPDGGESAAATEGAFPSAEIIKMAQERIEAIRKGNVEMVNTGDGVSKQPETLETMQIDSPRVQEEFAALESMVGTSMPGFDLRGDFKKDPEFYKELLSAIREGVPDEKTGKMRKLSTQEIISYIRGDS